MVSIIVATSLNNAIGKANAMLWHLPEDFKFFKNTTWGMPIIMGRKTFESIGKALPGRTNIIITSSKNWQINDTIAVANINEAIKTAEATNAKEIFITGGGEIYIQAMPKANKIYRTLVHTNIDGDTFFPKIDETVWVKTFEKNVAADEKNVFDMSFQTWERIGVVNDE
ncbi:MAG: dihydrofolate reductase [Ferruginibacter sp.]|nr:dihydrofolate reductase [Ferruginibacter sp.]